MQNASPRLVSPLLFTLFYFSFSFQSLIFIRPMSLVTSYTTFHYCPRHSHPRIRIMSPNYISLFPFTVPTIFDSLYVFQFSVCSSFLPLSIFLPFCTFSPTNKFLYRRSQGPPLITKYCDRSFNGLFGSFILIFLVFLYYYL